MIATTIALGVSGKLRNLNHDGSFRSANYQLTLKMQSAKAHPCVGYPVENNNRANCGLASGTFLQENVRRIREAVTGEPSLPQDARIGTQSGVLTVRACIVV